MAITVTALTGAGSATNGTEFVTDSIAPTGNRLVIFDVFAQVSGLPVEPTLGGNGITWVSVATKTEGTVNMRITRFRGMVASPSAGAVTITHSASVDRCIWSCYELAGVDTSGTNGSGAMVQTVTGNAIDATATVTLASFGSALNAVILCAGKVNGDGVTPEAGHTEIHDVAVVDGGDTNSIYSQYKVGEDTSPSATWSSGTFWVGMASEIKAAGGGGGGAQASQGLKGLSVFRSKGRRYWQGFTPDRSGLWVPENAREQLVKAA